MLEKLNDGWRHNAHNTCQDPEHNPPTMIVLEPGTYRHTCPGCGRNMIFTVPGVTCRTTTPEGI